jgi:hypothetical protein
LKTRKPFRLPISAALHVAAVAMSLVTFSSLVCAQNETTVERSAKGLPGKDIQIGVYLNVLPDCTSGTLPAIRLLTPPTNGAVSIKRGKVTATNYKQCLALEVPGFVAFYKSRPDFSGVDTVTIEVKYPAGGRTEIQHFSITIGDGKPGQKI